MLLATGLLVLAAGMALALQPVINATIAARVGHPLTAALVSVSVTFVALLAATLALRAPFPGPRALGAFEPWLLTGGLIGALFLVVSLYAAPKLGVATTVAVLIAGQVAAARAVEHVALLGVPQQPGSPLRLLGAALLVTGVVLIRRF